MMTEKIMSYIYMKPFKPEVASDGQIYWNSFYEDLYKLSRDDFNKNHNPGKKIFPERIKRISFLDLIKSFFDKKCKRIYPSI